jgi:hypothetical protein
MIETVVSNVTSLTTGNFIIYCCVIAVGVIVSVVSFALLIPLDTIPAVSGVAMIIGLSYVLSLLAWIIVISFYSSSPDNLVWLNTHLMFLVILPATIGATAMNVTSIQNTRNMLAGKV